MVAKDVLDELSIVRAEVNALSCRIDRLEKVVTPSAEEGVRISPTARSVPTVISHRLNAYSFPVPVKDTDHSSNKNSFRVECNANDVHQDVAHDATLDSFQHGKPHSSQGAPKDKSYNNSFQDARHSTSQDMETKIGTVWLNRIGIGSLVLGVVFLILYSFQYFGVTAKLMLGYLVSTALIFGGERISKNENRDWYGNALIGGGWSLMYFTAYAMHFIPKLKVIDSFTAELFILCGIAASAMRHAVNKNSEPLAVTATLLGVLAIAFGQVSHLSFIGYIAITAVAAFIAVSQRWTRVFYVALLTCYSAHFSTSVALSLPSGHLATIDCVWSMAALFPSWLVFTIAMSNLSLKLGKEPQSFLIASWVNAIYSIGAIFLFAQESLNHSTYLILTAAACCYFISAHFIRKKGLPLLADTHSLFALSILTLAAGNKFEGKPRMLAFLGQAIGVALIHLRNRNQIYAWFAPFLFVVAYCDWIYSASNVFNQFSTVPWVGLTSPILFLLGLVAVAACGALAWEYRKVSALPGVILEKNVVVWNALLHNIYILLANIFALSLPAVINGGEGRAFYWFLLTFVNSILYQRTEKSIYQKFTNISLLATVIAAVSFSSIQVRFSSFAILALLAVLDWSSSKTMKNYKGSLRLFAQATVFLALNLVFQLPAQTISVGLGGLGLVCLIVGFAAQIKVYRTWGLISLGLLSCRLVFVDLAHENTIERIIAFTVSGAVLLLGSYAYAKFADANNSKTPAS
jgi:uncharacterized membrane protein